jgi:DNA modification methylase
VETGSLDEAYPVELAELLIRMTDCLPGSIIFDPFGGGTGSLRAALTLGHTFYGFNFDGKLTTKSDAIVKEYIQKNKLKRDF